MAFAAGHTWQASTRVFVEHALNVRDANAATKAQTERAAENAVRIMAERGFPPGSALRIEVQGKRGEGTYVVSYDDLPTSDGQDWVGTSHGVPVLVAKRLAPLVQGMSIDFQDGRYVFKAPSKPSPAAHAVWDRELDT